ncbi:hypothetical protein AAVH_23040 [Aphelenchoides avenae]|nr:hypothetical protein AAVH_23040 [Aphelenchus avenae]
MTQREKYASSSFSGCALYALAAGLTSLTDGLIATDGSGRGITALDLVDPTTGRPYDIATQRERFTQIVSATCDGCAGECAQKHPTDY